MLTCKQIAARATDRMEGALGILDRRRFDRHVARCDACRRYVQQLQATVGALRRLPEPELSPRLDETLMAQYDAWAATRTGPLAASGATPELRARLGSRLWPTLAAAAVIALLVAFARHRSQAPGDWLVTAGLALTALAMAWLAGRFAVGLVLTGVLAAAAAALWSGHGDALGFPTGVECLTVELVSAAVVAGAAWLGARGGFPALVRRAQSTGAVAGALAADAALQITCPVHDALPHLLTFHLGGMLLVGVAAGWVALRNPAPAAVR
jgi:anti-sigma factor RsiW